ncbi:MAG: BadF/BadG/BcrA/BcrD ATPase family protein [Paracoccaceae bacterium]
MILGVDGGGTGCRAVVADRSGAILGRAEGGAANIATDFEAALQNVLETSAQAFRAAGLAGPEPGRDVGFLGLAGANVGDRARRMEAALPLRKVRVTSDRETTLYGALGAGDGCVAVVGTGSFFVGRHAGETVSIGGWGFPLGDDASGAWLGRALLRRVVLCHDGLARHSGLTRGILGRFGGGPEPMVEFAATAQPGDYAKFAPGVFEAARDGDENACEILDVAVRRIQLALDRVGWSEGTPLCLLGGLGPVYLEFLDPRYRADCRPARNDSLDAAVEMARRAFTEEREIDT